MRPSDKVNGREFSLSYGKLVRSTAIAANQAKVDNTLEAVTEYVTSLKSRVFQNLLWVVGMDDMTLSEGIDATKEIVAMFITDVHSELPSAKVNAGAKSKDAIITELQEASYNDALSYIKRMASGESMNGVLIESGAVGQLKHAFKVYALTCKENHESGNECKDVIDRLNAFGERWKPIWEMSV